MDYLDLIRKEIERGFTKSELEGLLNLPKNSLSAILNPDNKAVISKKGLIGVKAYFDKEVKPNPSDRIKRVVKNIKGVEMTTHKYPIKPKQCCKEINGTAIPQPKSEKPQMPKGLSLDDRIKWMEANNC